MKTDKQGRSNQKGTKRAVETFEDSSGGHQGEKQQALFEKRPRAEDQLQLSSQEGMTMLCYKHISWETESIVKQL